MLLLVLGNWFYLASMSRMLINSFETCLTVLSFWLWVNRRHQGYDIASRIVVGVAYIGRPTSIIPWMIIWPYELMTKREGHLYFICKNALQM